MPLLNITYYNSTATNYTTHCFQNVTLTPEQKEFFARRLSNIFKVYHGWLAMPLMILGLSLAIIYIAAVYRAIKFHRVSRKSYVLLLNRAIGDVLGCVVIFIIVCYVLLTDIINRDVMQLLDIFFVGTFWAAMVSYVSLSVLKLYAIARPLQYRNNVTMIRCIYLISLSWVIFLLITTYALLMTAFVKIPFLNEWTGCKIETCLRPMYRRRNVAVSVVYFFTIICFLLTLALVHKATELGKLFHRKSATSDTSGKKRSVARKITSRFPLWKLSLNVITFMIFNAPYVIWAVWLLTRSDECYFLRNYASMMHYLGILRATLLLRIIMDPILCFLTDYQIRRSMLAIFGLSRKIMPFSSHRDTQSEENSSECAAFPNRKTNSTNYTNSSGEWNQKTSTTTTIA